MKLITKELERTFSRYPIYSQESMILDAKVIVKYFNPIGAGTWLITEAEQLSNGDWRLFGYLRVGMGICAFIGASRNRTSVWFGHRARFISSQ